MIINLVLLVVLPIAAGLASLALKNAAHRKHAASFILLLGIVISGISFAAKPPALDIRLIEGFTLSLEYHVIAALIMVFINLFCFLVCVFAGDYGRDGRDFYSYLPMLAGFANLTVMAGDFLLFAFGWGAMLVLLYAFLYPGSPDSARKAATVVGTADFMLILGIAVFVYLSGSTAIPSDGAGLPMDSPLSFFAFLLLFAGAAGKAGAWPFHPWIPAASTTSSMPVMAILPASLDKLLGIYLLARVCTDVFSLSRAAMGLILLVGGFTVLFAVLMALVQKDARKLLSYHAVSQVGYMVIGFGTGVPIGFAAGVFHMLNNAIYKTGLFLSSGAAGKEKGTFDIGKMGGLARAMPATFVCALIFSLSISGVPPFNGFVSKWMVYQGAVSGMFAADGVLKVIFVAALLAAMFGSALTLASFVKFMHSVFLGQETAPEGSNKAPREAVRGMKYPLIGLAALCVVLGVFPGLFLENVAQPWIRGATAFTGEWDALAAFVLLALGLLAGAGLVFGKLVKKKLKVSDAYFGGQEKSPEINFPATEFYRTIREMPRVAGFYRILDLPVMDIYNVMTSGLRNIGFILYYAVDRFINLLTCAAGAAVLGISSIARKAHTGNLDFYVIWCLVAMVVLFIVIAG